MKYAALVGQEVAPGQKDASALHTVQYKMFQTEVWVDSTWKYNRL